MKKIKERGEFGTKMSREKRGLHCPEAPLFLSCIQLEGRREGSPVFSPVLDSKPGISRNGFSTIIPRESAGIEKGKTSR